MPYIGKSPLHGNYQKLDDFSGDFDGSDATHALAQNSLAITPVTEAALIISINGVIQEPVTDYTVSGTNITFTTAPASGANFFGVVLGEQLAIGTPSDATITVAKLATTLLTGATDIGAAIVDADLLLVDDGAGGTLRKTAASRIKTYVEASAMAVTGNVTATGTMEPAGATAAGDNAAIGYTSALGLVLTGQGSTNDITFNNDAGNRIMRIETGSTTLKIDGNCLANTFSPEGDTSASMTTGLGYTSAEGLILTGQGSTSDITLKNDADATALTVPTGTTNVDIVGNLSTANINVDNGGSVVVGHTAAVTTTAAATTQILGTGAADSMLTIGRFSADALGPAINFLHSRNASLGGNTIHVDNDIIGTITAHVADGNDFVSSAANIIFEVDDASVAQDEAGGAIAFGTTTDGASSPTERVRIDNTGIVTIADGGSLVVGKSGAAISMGGSKATVQTVGTAQADSTIAVARWSADATASRLIGFKSRHATIGSTAIVQDDDNLLDIVAYADDAASDYFEAPAAMIRMSVDGTPGTNDMPGRITFHASADGGQALGEVMRIDNSGHVGIQRSSAMTSFTLNVDDDGTVAPARFRNDLTGTSAALDALGNNASYDIAVLDCSCTRTATTAFHFIRTRSAHGGANDPEHILYGDGTSNADGAWSASGVDYAEYFEWDDGNPDNEDRVGKSVSLVEEKIKIAESGETAIGIVSGRPSFAAGNAGLRWNQKYQKDEFDRYIMEDYVVVYWEEDDFEELYNVMEKGVLIAKKTVKKKKTIKHSYATEDVPDGLTVPDRATRTTQQRRKPNPSFDADLVYVPRIERKEWSAVGVVGKLGMYKGQETDPRWIKLRDVSDEIEEWLVR